MISAITEDLTFNSTIRMARMRRREKGTFGWRVSIERDEKGLTQTDVIERLQSEFGIKMLVISLSEIETGKTKRVTPELIVALAKILGVDPAYLLTGEERGDTTHYSEEAEQIAGMVDRMQASTRQMMMSAARAAMQLENELLETQRELAQILQENIMLLEESARRKADAYIDRIGHRTGRG